MPVKLHYNFKDIFRAARFGLSIKKIWVQFLGLVLGASLYSIFAYLSLWVSGYSLKEVWNQYHLLPILYAHPLTFFGNVLHIIGIILFLSVTLLFATAVSKILFEQLRGDEFYEIKESLKFAFKKGLSSFLTPFSILVIIGFILLCGVIYGAIGKIPWVGEIFFIIFLIPAFFVCLFLVYLCVAFLVSMFISPSISGSTGNDTFDTLFEVFSTLNEQPWRVLVYEVLLFAVMFTAGGIFTWLVGRAVGVGVWVLSANWLMGTKFTNILHNAWAFLPSYPFLYKWSSFFQFLNIEEILQVPSGFEKLPILQSAIAYLTGIFGYCIIFLVISYYLSVFNSGNTLLFITLFKKKDDIDLLEEEKEEEEEKKRRRGEKRGGTERTGEKRRRRIETIIYPLKSLDITKCGQ